LAIYTRQESVSFEPLIGFLALQVQKLWPKNNKLINYLIMGLINYVITKARCYSHTQQQMRVEL